MPLSLENGSQHSPVVVSVAEAGDVFGTDFSDVGGLLFVVRFASQNGNYNVQSFHLCPAGSESIRCQNVNVHQLRQLVERFICAHREFAVTRVCAGVVGDDVSDVACPKSWNLNFDSWFQGVPWVRCLYVLLPI